jgi:hypothetical protein
MPADGGWAVIARLRSTASSAALPRSRGRGVERGGTARGSPSVTSGAGDTRRRKRSTSGAAGRRSQSPPKTSPPRCARFDTPPLRPVASTALPAIDMAPMNAAYQRIFIGTTPKKRISSSGHRRAKASSTPSTAPEAPTSEPPAPNAANAATPPSAHHR